MAIDRLQPVPRVGLIGCDHESGISRAWQQFFEDERRLVNAAPWERRSDVIRLKDETTPTPVEDRTYDSAGHSTFELVRADGTRKSPVAVSSGQTLGEYRWGGFHTSALYATGALIRASASEDWSGTAEFTAGVEQIGNDGLNSGFTGWNAVSALAANDDFVLAARESGTNLVYTFPGTTWTQRSPGWGAISGSSAEGVNAAHYYDGAFYLGIGEIGLGGAELWAMDASAFTWTTPGEAADLPSAGGVLCIASEAGRNRIYVGTGSGANADRVFQWDIDSDTWTNLTDPAPFAAAIDAVHGLEFLKDGPRRLYALCRDGTGDDHWVYRLNLDLLLSWEKIGDPATTTAAFADVNIGGQRQTAVANGQFFAGTFKNTGTDGGVYRFNGTADDWTRVGGGGTGFTGNVHCLFSLPDGRGFLAGVATSDSELQIHVYDAVDGTWTLVHDFGASSGYDRIRSLAVSPSGDAYCAMGIGANDGDVYTLGAWSNLFTGTDVELRLVPTGTGADVRTMRFYASQDVGIGGPQTDGLYYDHSALSVGIRTTSPARTLHVAGAEGMRIDASPAPSAVAAGDLYFNSADNNLLTFHDDTAARRVAHAPLDITDNRLVRGDGGATGIQEGAATETDDGDVSGWRDLAISRDFSVGGFAQQNNGQIENITSAEDAINTLTAFGSSAESRLVLSRGRGTPGSPSAVQSGDVLSTIEFRGKRNTTPASNWRTGAEIEAVAHQNFSDSAAGTYLVFRTTSDGNTSPTERLRIRASGDVLFANTATLPNTGLHLLDTDSSHDLIVKPGSNLSADRTLTLTTGDADRTLALSANVTLDGTEVKSSSALGTDNVLVRSDGISRNVQATGITVNDSDELLIGSATSINGQVQTIKANTGFATLTAASFGASSTGSNVLAIRGRGTQGSPTALQSGDVIGGFLGRGQYDTTPGNIHTAGHVQFAAAENWSGTNRGGRMLFGTTTPGGTTTSNKMTLESGLQIGSPTGGDPGVGALNLQSHLEVVGDQVVGAQQGAIADADGTLADATSTINEILDALQAHGLIAT